MLKKSLVLLILMSFSLVGFSQEEKKKVDFKNSTMITSYVLMGAGVLAFSAGASGMVESSVGGGAAVWSIFGGPPLFTAGAVVGVVDTISQLRKNSLAYEEILNEYEDIIVDSEVLSLDGTLPFQSKVSRELMSELKQSSKFSDKEYFQRLSTSILEIDNFAYDVVLNDLPETKIDLKLKEISKDVMSLQHARNLIAIKIFSLQV